MTFLRRPGASYSYTVEELTPDKFAGVDIALFSMPKSVSRDVAWKIVEHGTVIVDNSNAWRMDSRVPLVVPDRFGLD